MKPRNYRFTFGPWNISQGSDPFGPVVRKEVQFAKKIARYRELGFTYVGPVDGHNIGELIETFKQVKGVDEPVFVHAITTKGKGLDWAEDDPFKHHAAKVLATVPSPPTPPRFIRW